MVDDKETLDRRRRRTFYAVRVAALAALVSVAGLALSAGGDTQASDASTTGPTTLDGVFTAEQVEGIAATYARACAMCHGDELGGSASAPPLVGLPFMFFWEGKTVAELYTFIHDNMPLGNAGSLTDQEYADLVALILDANGFPAGEAQLLPDAEALAQLTIAPAPAGEGE